MKILNHSISNQAKLNKLSNNKNISSSIVEQKKYQKDALELQGVQNLAFCGFKMANDAKYLTESVKMGPYRNYEICDDSTFYLSGNVYLDIFAPDVKPLIGSLKFGESIEFGTSANSFKGINSTVDSRHLKISRGFGGKLYAENISDGKQCLILSNIAPTPDFSKEFDLRPDNMGRIVPIDGSLKLGCVETLSLNRLKKQIEKLPEGKSLIIGRGTDCDYRVTKPEISRKHASIKRCGDEIIVKDLYSMNGTVYIPPKNYSPVSQMKEITLLKPKVETVIPNDSQLYLGNNFTIDVRNPNIQAMLERKGSITIGRDAANDLVVNPFYDQVSKNHLKLTKKNGRMYATDLQSMNGTRVIPKHKIQPFYSDLNKLELSQANVGDCYLLSTIYAMSRSSLGRKMLQNMVKVDDEGNYIVTFYNQEPIKVRLDELDGQKRGYEEKRSVSGDLGVKALERAYGKLLKKEHEERMIFMSLHGNENATMFADIDNGGFMTTALEKMTGIPSRRIYMGMFFPDKELEVLSRNIDKYIITCSTPKLGQYDGYVDKQRRFNHNHAYSIKNIDSRNKMLEIVNPHNTMKTQWISWHEFREMFDYLCYTDLLNSMS